MAKPETQVIGFRIVPQYSENSVNLNQVVKEIAGYRVLKSQVAVALQSNNSDGIEHASWLFGKSSEILDLASDESGMVDKSRLVGLLTQEGDESVKNITYASYTLLKEISEQSDIPPIVARGFIIKAFSEAIEESQKNSRK